MSTINPDDAESVKVTITKVGNFREDPSNLLPAIMWRQILLTALGGDSRSRIPITPQRLSSKCQCRYLPSSIG